MPRNQTPQERAARALCRHAGNSEDTTYQGRPMWESFLPEALAALDAVSDPPMPRRMPPAVERALAEVLGWRNTPNPVELYDAVREALLRADRA